MDNEQTVISFRYIRIMCHSKKCERRKFGLCYVTAREFLWIPILFGVKNEIFT